MYTIDTLLAEHENIQRLRSVMKAACLRLLEGEAINIKDFRLFIDFIRIYADKTHHGKEEAFLFKEMMDRLGPMALTLIQNGMLVEHDLGRLYVKQLEDAVNLYEEKRDNESKLLILTNAMAYADLLGRHITRENGAVFPFAERNLSPQVLSALDVQTKTYEEKNADVIHGQLAVLSQLSQKYTG